MNPREIRSKLYYVLGHWEKGNIYDYYLDEDQSIRGGYNLSSKGTKWEGESEYVQDELNGWGVLLKDKKVIEISGGPGYFAKELSPVSRKWVVTEYSQVSAERMRNILGLEAIKFDFNSDDLSKIVDDTFDIVLLRHCINFCSDIRKFLGSIKRVIHKDTVIYCSFTQPTFASCLRWSVDDYTFPILYHPETIQKLFAEEGFIAFGKKEQGTRHWIYGGYWMTGGVHWGHVMTSPVTIPYYFLNRFKNIDVSTREKNLAMIFRKNPDARW
ncbi:MAG: methyltransferase domain-containing protein [candidate division Zixibacteria bacterium]|nr:methyltransferase domain-containing protein [candidate division Zixibacteria bacterium]